MKYPRIVINPNIIEKNVRRIVDLSREKGIEVVGVTKGVCAYQAIVDSFVRGGVKYLADSRIENLKKLEKYKLDKIMLRLPMVSQAEEVVKYSDISLNSEVKTVKALSREAIRQEKLHKVILMVDLGDLREGYFYQEELYRDVEEILKLKGVEIIGIGTNLTCYGGVIPKRSILEKLLEYKYKLESNYNLNLEIISGGNSSTIQLVKEDIPEAINNLRLGEVLLLGRETAYGKQIKGTSSKGFILEAEIIEIKRKPSRPIGEIGRDAFGQLPKFKDKGIRERILCGIGRQDVKLDSLIPEDKGLEILGGSSDHMILDSSNSQYSYRVGNIIRFNLTYGGILSAMTSEYITKVDSS